MTKPPKKPPLNSSPSLPARIAKSKDDLDKIKHAWEEHKSRLDHMAAMPDTGITVQDLNNIGKEERQIAATLDQLKTLRHTIDEEVKKSDHNTALNAVFQCDHPYSPEIQRLQKQAVREMKATDALSPSPVHDAEVCLMLGVSGTLPQDCVPLVKHHALMSIYVEGVATQELLEENSCLLDAITPPPPPPKKTTPQKKGRGKPPG